MLGRVNPKLSALQNIDSGLAFSVLLSTTILSSQWSAAAKFANQIATLLLTEVKFLFDWTQTSLSHSVE